MTDLQGRVALITAASKGVGASIVRDLAQLGSDIAFTYLSDSEAAKRVESEVQKLGRRCVSFQACAGDYNAAQKIVAEVQRQLGGLHILVCNAGIARSAPLASMSEQDWDDVIKVSLKGAFNYMRAAAPVFMAQQDGKIVCIGSINGLRGRLGSASYNAAKAGLIGLVKTAAAELGRHNINVNLIAPGFIDSPSQVNTPELIRDLVLKECAIKRLGRPEDISSVVAFLCTEGARHVTGQVIKVDAGQYL